MINTERPRVKDVKGTVRAYLSKQSRSMKEYVVILHRGEEADLISKLDGELSNLVTFCDNNFNFNNKISRHYGGQVVPCWVSEEDNSFGGTRRSFCYSNDKPNDNYTKAYQVTVYID